MPRACIRVLPFPQQLEGPEVLHIYKLSVKFYIYAQYRCALFLSEPNAKEGTGQSSVSPRIKKMGGLSTLKLFMPGNIHC